MSLTGLRYRAASHLVVPRWRRWWPLARHEFGILFRSKWGVALFCACLLPLVVRTFVLMIRFGVVNFGANPRRNMLAQSQAFAQWDPLRPDFYVEMVMGTWPGLLILVLITSSVSAAAVARDRRTNALELFWTRGISPWGYLLAKWVGSLLLLSLLTCVGPVVLWGFACLMAEDWSLCAETAPFLVPMLAGLLLATAAWTAICVLLSALSQSPNQAIVGWCMLVVGSTAVGAVLSRVFHDPSIRTWLSIWDAGGVVARQLAGVTARGPFESAAMFLGGLLLLLLLFVRRRLALAEAIG